MREKGRGRTDRERTDRERGYHALIQQMILHVDGLPEVIVVEGGGGIER